MRLVRARLPLWREPGPGIRRALFVLPQPFPLSSPLNPYSQLFRTFFYHCMPSLRRAIVCPSLPVGHRVPCLPVGRVTLSAESWSHPSLSLCQSMFCSSTFLPFTVLTSTLLVLAGLAIARHDLGTMTKLLRVARNRLSGRMDRQDGKE